MLYRYHLFRHKFCVFLKLRFSDKRFSSWPLACHKIILPVRMLRMLRTLFCRDTSFFFHTYYHLRLRCRNSTFDSSTRRLDRDAVGTCLGASISSDHFPSFENVENFVLSWNIQNVHPFHPRPTETDWRNFVNCVTFFEGKNLYNQKLCCCWVCCKFEMVLLLGLL